MRAIAILLLFLGGCGTSAGDARPPAGPLEVGGFTVTAPPGDGWRMAERSEDAVVFTRDVGPGGHQLVAMAALFPFEFADLDECRASLERDTLVETPTHRAPRRTLRVVAEAALPYVLVRYGAEERSAPDDGEGWKLLTSEFRWYLRPGDGRGVMQSFTERRPAAAAPIGYAAQAEAFFGSLRF